MSNQALTWAFEQPVPASEGKFLLVTLANYANSDGFCYPSQKTLAIDCGMSERTVREHIGRLEKAGYIQREERRRGNGSKTSDGFWLVGFGAEIPADSSGKPKGRSREGHRQILPSSPADSAGPEPLVEPLITDSDESVEKIQPKDLFQAFLDVRGQTWDDYDRKREIPRFLKLAKELIGSGVSPGDVSGCTLWLEGQRSWRTTPTTFVMVGGKIRDWIREGRPGSSGASQTAKGQGATGQHQQGSGSATGHGYDQWVRDNPPAWAAGIIGSD